MWNIFKMCTLHNNAIFCSSLGLNLPRRSPLNQDLTMHSLDMQYNYWVSNTFIHSWLQRIISWFLMNFNRKTLAMYLHYICNIPITPSSIILDHWQSDFHCHSIVSLLCSIKHFYPKKTLVIWFIFWRITLNQK